MAVPVAWWRPALEATRLLDAVGSVAAAPVAIRGGEADLVVPALVRFPAAMVIGPTGVLASAIADLTGAVPTVVAANAVGPETARTLLWLAPPPTAVALRGATRCLATGGLLAIAARGARATLRWRSLLRRGGFGTPLITGYLGPRALAWSAAGRLFLRLGWPDRYDRCHAAMRQRYAEGWPWALGCQLTLLVTRRT